MRKLFLILFILLVKSSIAQVYYDPVPEIDKDKFVQYLRNQTDLFNHSTNPIKISNPKQKWNELSKKKISANWIEMAFYFPVREGYKVEKSSFDTTCGGSHKSFCYYTVKQIGDLYIVTVIEGNLCY